MKKTNSQSPSGILFVDDEIDLLETISESLSYFKIENFYCSSNANQALDIIKNNPIDLIFCDLNMPTMTGIDFYYLSQPLSPDCAFVLMTGLKVNDIEQEVPKDIHFIQKPFDINQVLAIIKGSKSSAKAA